MTKPPPKAEQVERAVVEVLADLVEQRTRPKPIPTPKPAPKRTTPKPPIPRKAPMRRRAKTTKPPVPKRTGVRMLLADDAPDTPPTFLHEQERERSRGDSLRPSASAHGYIGYTPCRVCGGGVAPGGDSWGPWREHRDCARVAGSEAARVIAAAQTLLGVAVDAQTARLVKCAVPAFHAVHSEPVWNTDDRKRDRGPWAHVATRALREAVEEAESERAEASIPRPCEWGRCGWCGVEEAVAWHDHGHRWADGSPAPLCDVCSSVYERRGRPSPSFWSDQRPALAEALSGAPTMLEEVLPAALLAFAESNAEGSGKRWSHLDADAVAAFRWNRWGRLNGKHAPAEHKVEAVARHEAAQAQRTAREAALEAADPFGFGGQQEAANDD